MRKILGLFHRRSSSVRSSTASKTASASHVLLCWLALLLIRVAERRSEMTWRQISTELRRVHAVELAGPAGEPLL